jgi:hypothetical protein
MPIVPHPACTEPPEDTVICRFMSFLKFHDLVASEELYLRRVDRFKETDPQEGLPSRDYVRKILGLRKYVLEDELTINSHQGFNRQDTEGHYILCWQLFEGETAEMWTTYGKGVAIFSRFGLLKTALNSQLDPINIGIVRYGDKHTQGYNLIDFLFTKRRHFEKEKELRVVLQCYDPMAGGNRQFDENNIPHEEPLDENPMHEWVHDHKRRRIDLKSLVTGIRMSPWATEEEVEDVWWWVKNKNLGLSCPIMSSNLAVPRTNIPAPDRIF